MGNIFRLMAALLCSMSLVVTPVFAATTTSPLTAQANVAASCTITGVTNINFGTYDTTSATPTDAAGNFTFRCTKNTSYDLYIAGTRSMANATEGLSYELYQDAYSTTWPVGSPGVTGVSPNNAPVVKTVNGRIPTLQDVGIGAFTNSVNVTVSY